MDFKNIQKITDEEYDGNLTDYQNKVKLHERLDKELEGTDRVFLKILKNDIKELEPIDDYTEYLVGQMKEYDRQKKGNNQRIQMTTLTILYLIFAKDTALKENKLITPTIMKRVLYIRTLKNKVRSYLSKGFWKDFQILVGEDMVNENLISFIPSLPIL